MTFRDFLPICEGFALIALVLIAAVLLVWYLERRQRDRFARVRAKWQAMGLAPEARTWPHAVTVQHRGRSLTMSLTSFTSLRHPDYDAAVVTRVRTVARSPLGSRLTITPKWPQLGMAGWLYRRSAPKTNAIEDHFSLQSDPPELAGRLSALPRISAILLSQPKPAIDLKAGELRFERPGFIPLDPQDALALFDTVCDLAELIEEASPSPGAG